MDAGTSTLRTFRILADATRMRLIALLETEELSVGELQEITRMGQSRISTHLGQLQESGLVRSRKSGKRTLYRLEKTVSRPVLDIVRLAVQGASELEEHQNDQLNLKYIQARRKDPSDAHFNQVAGRFDRSYGPGRSWQAFGQLLLKALPPLVIADLGSGEGLLSELLAKKASKVIAVDNSEKIVRFGIQKAKKNGLHNLEFRLGDLQNPPIDDQTVDLVVLSQALHHAENPGAAIQSAFRILKPSGQILILDLQRHDFEKARELYGDRWLGFTEGELHDWLIQAGFHQVEISIVASEPNPPHFNTLLAAGSVR